VYKALFGLAGMPACSVLRRFIWITQLEVDLTALVTEFEFAATRCRIGPLAAASCFET